MSKVSFRARQIDFNKPIPIIKCEDGILPDIGEYAAINRGVPQMPTGMEKEEETEHHIQEALTALQQFRTTEYISIPVPDIIEDYKHAESIYNVKNFQPPRQLIHIQSFLFDNEEAVDYDMDSEDEEWLQKSNLGITPLHFETLIDKLEKGCGHKVMSLDEARGLLREDPSLVIAVYDYWLTKRIKTRHPMILQVKPERRDGTNNNDPYIAFRRRTEKMQTRKNRKNDEQSYEKMVRLKIHMQRLGEIVDCVLKRDKGKDRLIDIKRALFKARYALNDWDGWILRESETAVSKQGPLGDPLQSLQNDSISHKDEDDLDRLSSRKRRRPNRHLHQRSQSSDILSENEDECDLDGQFAFIRLPGCVYKKPRDMFEPLDSSALTSDRSRFQLTTFPALVHTRHKRSTGYLRRRVGRGGRIIFDRLVTPHTPFLTSLSDSVGLSSDEDHEIPSPTSYSNCSDCFYPSKVSRTQHTGASELSHFVSDGSSNNCHVTSRLISDGKIFFSSRKPSTTPNGDVHTLCQPSSKPDHNPVASSFSSSLPRVTSLLPYPNGTTISEPLHRSSHRLPANVPSKGPWPSSKQLINFAQLQKTPLGCHPSARQSWDDKLHDTSEELT